MGTSVLPTYPLCQPSGCPHSASVVLHPRIQATGCFVSFYISEHSQSLLSAGGSWNQPSSYAGGNCILRFSVSLKLFPNKQFILSALPHVRESSAPWISADGEDGPPPALRGCPPLTLSLWNLGRPLPRLLLAGRSSANDAGNAVGVQETFVEAWR